MNTELYSTHAQQAAMQAYGQLVQLNLELHKPQVNEWLHSEAAEPALRVLLANVPCFGQMN